MALTEIDLGIRRLLERECKAEPAGQGCRGQQGVSRQSSDAWRPAGHVGTLGGMFFLLTSSETTSRTRSGRLL